MEDKNKGSVEGYKAGKSISNSANEKLKEIRKKVNEGDFKKKYSEREIISEAVLSFSEEHIERLKNNRQSGNEALMEIVNQVFQSSEESGEMSLDDYLKRTVAPVLKQQLTKKIKTSKKTKQQASSPISISQAEGGVQ